MIDADQFQPGRLHALESAPLSPRLHLEAHRASLCIGDAECACHPAIFPGQQAAGLQREAAADVATHPLPVFAGQDQFFSHLPEPDRQPPEQDEHDCRLDECPPEGISLRQADRQQGQRVERSQQRQPEAHRR
jgi:hypothetical protein